MIGLARKTASRVLLRLALRAERRRRERLGMLDHDLTPDLWGAEVGPEGHLVIGGCDTVRLAETYGTPLLVVDEERLRKNYTEFLETFRRRYPRVDIGYSYKTNPLPGVLRVLHEVGACAEVISHFELWLALKLGVAPERVIFNGPAKTPEALALAVKAGVHLINIDNVDEIDEIERLASASGRIQKVGVRLVTSVGWSSQFGLSIRSGAARDAFERIRRCASLDPRGLHIHLGTGIKDIEIYVQAIREVLEFARAIRGEIGVEIRIFDFGGGFGVPTVRPFESTDMRLMANGFPPLAMDAGASPRLESYADAIAGLFREHAPSGGAEDPLMIFEPGRAVTSSSQTLLLRVLAVKPAEGGGHRVILDGGKNLAMPPGYEYHEVLAASKLRDAPHGAYDVFGPLCHPGDVLCVRKRLPLLEPGDVVAVMDAGAYFVPNQMNFSNPRCGAVMVRSGTARMIRRHESFEDVVRRDDLGEGLEQAAPNGESIET
jgi:diaminopimelate decarboxylase